MPVSILFFGSRFRLVSYTAFSGTGRQRKASPRAGFEPDHQFFRSMLITFVAIFFFPTPSLLQVDPVQLCFRNIPSIYIHIHTFHTYIYVSRLTDGLRLIIFICVYISLNPLKTSIDRFGLVSCAKPH